jgi:hypothetical protein
MTKRTGALRWVLWLVCRACLAGGIGTLLTGCGLIVFQSIWLARSVPGHGTIVEVIPVRDQEQNTTNYAPRFRFNADDGHTYTATSSVATNPPGFELGQRVRVRYMRTNPSSAKLDYFGQLWFPSVVFGAGGILFTTFGYLLLRLERRRSSQLVSV